jgi:hypothetical protein
MVSTISNVGKRVQKTSRAFAESVVVRARMALGCEALPVNPNKTTPLTRTAHVATMKVIEVIIDVQDTSAGV